MIRVIDGDLPEFILETDKTTYGFRVIKSGHLEHLYYGERVDCDSLGVCGTVLKYQQGNMISYSPKYSNLNMEILPMELSSVGKGDVREPMVLIKNVDGSYTSDFVYESYDICRGSEITKPDDLPTARLADERLVVTLSSVNRAVKLYLSYDIYEKCDCITKSASIVNNEKSDIVIERLLSNQIDFKESDYELINFTGAWIREMNYNATPVTCARLVNSSSCGVSSSRSNPLVVLKQNNATEDFGGCYGFNLIYSGNHYESVCADAFGKMRFLSGINPEGFSYVLEPGGTFVAPEAVLTFSWAGLNGMSENMHNFVRKHIVRGTWADKPRPVLLNSWEAAYFKFDENKLVSMAKVAAKAGIELFVMDDGWFGVRNDDAHSLGDWSCNTKKLPGGLSRICKRINELGLMFGIWVEPEMVNVNSECYRMHPDWAVDIGDNHSEGRNQRILDLTRKDVRDFIVGSMTNVFSAADIFYVKWDMNRIFSDTYSRQLTNQQEFLHRYVLGLYDVLKRITEKFPDILFEGCASGGNRFDLGMLVYMPQIWASDNTDALCRARIQTGYSYGYPMSVISAHVSSCPNHQTLRTTSIETRFEVAMFGCLGYECNMVDMSRADLEKVRAQVELYKSLREVLFTGDYIRISNGTRTEYGNSVYEWICVSKDKNTAIAFQMQDLTVANNPEVRLKTKGLDDEKIYEMTNRALEYDVRDFGDLINTVSPIHIKQDSLTHNVIARFVKMQGETEKIRASGGVFNKCGVSLHQNFAATGYDSEVRYYQDFSSRIYVFRAVVDESKGE